MGMQVYLNGRRKDGQYSWATSNSIIDKATSADSKIRAKTVYVDDDTGKPLTQADMTPTTSIDDDEGEGKEISVDD
jgi:hypothetical protein